MAPISYAESLRHQKGSSRERLVDEVCREEHCQLTGVVFRELSQATARLRVGVVAGAGVLREKPWHEVGAKGLEAPPLLEQFALHTEP